MPVAVPVFLDALGVPRTAGGTLTGIATDHRCVRPGDAFFAFRGRRHDGNAYLGEALQRGAVLSIGSAPSGGDPRCIRVDEPLHALGVLAGLVRGQFQGPVVGITGSAGKTTVKECLRQLLGSRLRAVFPEGSFNNAEGVPRTVCSVEADTELLVVELGTSRKGEIAALCRIARPTMGILTSVGPAHLQGLGSVEGVLEEKLDLLRALPAGATTIVNGDDPVLRRAKLPGGLRIVFGGLEVREGVEAPRSYGPGRLVLEDGVELECSLGTATLLRNLWLALLAARELGHGPGSLRSEAARVHPAPLRGEIVHLNAARIILDCYNANPLSMDAALADLERAGGRRFAVLGEMLDLGAETAARHRALGERIARSGIEEAIFIGPSGEAVRRGTLGGRVRVAVFTSLEEARGEFDRLTREPATILLKASRGMALENLLAERSRD